MKRFWKDVGIDKRGNSLAVTLDKRALKTPSGKVLLVPASKPLLATLIATEWDHQTFIIKPHALPVVSSPPFHMPTLGLVSPILCRVLLSKRVIVPIDFPRI